MIQDSNRNNTCRSREAIMKLLSKTVIEMLKKDLKINKVEAAYFAKNCFGTVLDDNFTMPLKFFGLQIQSII